MRKIERIKPIMNSLEEIWMENPDWRFGQLISNVIGQIMCDNKIGDMFFPEDNVWEKGLKDYLKSHSIYNYGQDLLKEENDEN